jgi:hypothetical protein
MYVFVREPAMNRILRGLAVCSLITLIGTASADAAAVRAGATTAAIAALTRGSAVAYDSVNQVYLVVSTFGTLRGRFVDRHGTPLGAAFLIQSTANYTHFPTVAFSPDADGGGGGFLVVWHESLAVAVVKARMVSYRQSGPIGAESILSAEGSFWEQYPAAAYSTGSHEFLVSWVRFGWGIRAVRVTNNAAPKTDVFTITFIPGQSEGNPSVAYGAATDQFLVVWKGYNDPTATGYVDARLVQAGTNQLLGAGATRVAAGGGTYITDVTYNSSANQFLVAWYRDAGGSAKTTLGRVVNADLSLPGNIIPLSSLWKAYDALSVAYNTLSNTFFMVSHDARSTTAVEDGGVEINSVGVPVDNGFLVTAGAGKPNYYPRLAPGADDPNWLVGTSYGFEQTVIQLIAGTSSGAAPTPPPPSPVTRPPNPVFFVDTPTNNATVLTTGFLISGWAVDTGTASGTGMDVVVCWAYPKSGAPAILAGVASYGHPRPDIGAWLGPNFAPSGWGLLGVLPPGSYMLAIYAHSTVSNSWGVPKLLDATVQAPPSEPHMFVDFPAQNSNVSQNIVIAGWALDRASANGSGVDTLHIYAYLAGTNLPIFLGVAERDARPDVAAAFGSDRFTNAGFHLSTSALGPGNYSLVIFAHSSVTQTFNNTAVVAVTVR